METQTLEDEAVIMDSGRLPLFKSPGNIATRIIYVSNYGKRMVNFCPKQFFEWKASGFMDLIDSAIERLDYVPNWLGNSKRNGRVYNLREL